jgi:pimeloyl-ACP methyl ester carboxylesterase
MLPFLEQSDQRGWGVVILNPNEDAPGIGRDDQQVSHALQNFVGPTQNVVIIAHSRGGASTADAMRKLQAHPRSSNVRAIALTDSVHHPQQIDDRFRSLSLNWVRFSAC